MITSDNNSLRASSKKLNTRSERGAALATAILMMTLLSAIAMMCAGYDGSKEINPGFPKDGRWKVRWEGLERMF